MATEFTESPVNMEAKLPALVWLTRHMKNCLNGDHEASDFVSVRGIAVDTPVGLPNAAMCIHCRSVFVKKEE